MKLDFAEVQVFVGNLAEAKTFYRDVLGLTLCAESAGWLVFDVSGVLLVALPGGARREPRRPYGSECGTVLCLRSFDLDADRAYLESQGVEFLTATKTVSQGRFAAFCDPDGNLFELVEKDG